MLTIHHYQKENNCHLIQGPGKTCQKLSHFTNIVSTFTRSWKDLPKTQPLYKHRFNIYKVLGRPAKNSATTNIVSTFIRSWEDLPKTRPLYKHCFNIYKVLGRPAKNLFTLQTLFNIYKVLGRPAKNSATLQTLFQHL